MAPAPADPLSAEERLAVTRRLVRRILRDLSERSADGRREMGRRLAAELGSPDPATLVAAFRGAGMGDLALDEATDGRYRFSLMNGAEVRPGASKPTCHLTVGFVEGVVAAARGVATLGSETRCQSQGHDCCVFAVRAR